MNAVTVMSLTLDFDSFDFYSTDILDWRFCESALLINRNCLAATNDPNFYLYWRIAILERWLQGKFSIIRNHSCQRQWNRPVLRPSIFLVTQRKTVMLQNSSKNSSQAELKPVIAGKALNFKLGFQQKSDAVLKVRHAKFWLCDTWWKVLFCTGNTIICIK